MKIMSYAPDDEVLHKLKLQINILKEFTSLI